MDFSAACITSDGCRRAEKAKAGFPRQNLSALPGGLVVLILELARGEVAVFALLFALGAARAGAIAAFHAVLELRHFLLELEITFVAGGAEGARGDRGTDGAAGVGPMLAVVELAVAGE